MADVGRALISKIITEGDITTAMSAGIKPSWFEDDEHRGVYQWATEYFTRYGEAPTERAVHTQFPNYRILTVGEPYDFYLDTFRSLHHRSIMVDTVVEADSALREDDTNLAQQALSRGLLRVGKEVSSLTDVNVGGKMRTRYDEYEESRKWVGKLRGVRTGFNTLDYLTGGYLDQQFIIFGGQQKQGKSFMLMKSAIAAQEHGRTVLFISFEMSHFEQTVRYDGITCGINANRLLRGNLEDEHMKKLRVGMSQRKKMNYPPFIMAADISASTTVSGLAGKIEQHRPDIVFIDGCYLMEAEDGSDPQSPQAMTSISRGLKRLAQRINKPVVGTTQALPGKMKSGVVTMHSLGWTSAWSQDADLIMGVEKDDTAPLITVRIVAGRNVPPAEMGIQCVWDESLFEELEQ